MSLAAKLEALKNQYENKNATLRALFEQRLDTLRNNIISFIGNALHDETANILNQSDTTRAFVVDRILEVVSDNLESEKETTIYKLIQNVNDLTKKCDTLSTENQRLTNDNQTFLDTQKVIDDNSDELNKLKESVAEKELKIKSQTDKIKSIEDELKIKTHEFDRQQTQTDQQHEHIQKLHEKLENTLKNLQNQQSKFDKQQTKFDQHCIENKQLTEVNKKHESELKQCHKQIETLRTSLMKSESERLVLRKQYMDIGQKLETITNSQNNQVKQFEHQQKEKNEAIVSMKNELQKVVMENETLKTKLHKQSHSLSKKMKQELGKTKILCDDVAILRKQLESERNISKMYVDELQKLKMELNQKNMELNQKSMAIHTNQQYIDNAMTSALSSQKKKMHRYYQKMIDSNMTNLRNEYESHIAEITEQYNETLLNIQKQEQEKLLQEQSKLLLRIKEKEDECNKDKEKMNDTEQEIKQWQLKLEEHKSKQEALQTELEKYQKENEKLRDDITNKENEIKNKDKSHNEEKESFQRLMHDSRKENDDLTEVISKLRDKMNTIQESKYEETSKANVMEYDLRQNIEELTQKMKQLQRKNESMKSKLDHEKSKLNKEKSNIQKKEKSNWKYQQKLKLIHEFCRKIQREIRNNKNEIEYIKTSIQMYLDRAFHEIQISFTEIQAVSAKHILSSKSGMKEELTKSMKQFKKYQDSKLQSMEEKLKKTAISINNKEPIKDLDLTALEDEVDTIKNELAQAKNVLSPKKIKFKKISLPSSMDSSAILSNKSSLKKKKKKTKKNKYLNRESYDTATIRKLRNDLQSLEENYQFNKKYIKKKYSKNNKQDDDSSISIL